MASGLGHASHPFEFGAIEVIGSGYLRPFVVETLLAFLQIVGIIATIGIDGPVVEFEDHGADAVEEEAVVGDHQQCAPSAGQITLQPFDHLKVKMVGRLVENQEVGLGEQHIGKCHTLLLTT